MRQDGKSAAGLDFFGIGQAVVDRPELCQQTTEERNSGRWQTIQTLLPDRRVNTLVAN